jgi:hypothetical protein
LYITFKLFLLHNLCAKNQDSNHFVLQFTIYNLQ